MAIKIGIMNQKGGVGKSSLVTILADNLRNHGKVLVLDLDQQNNQRTLLNVRSRVSKEATAYSILLQGYSPKSTIVNVTNNVDLISSGGKHIENFDRIYRTQDENEIILKRKMAELENEYDYIVIDSSPTMNLIHANIACYADFLIIPCDMEILSFSATRSILHFMESFDAKISYPTAQILGVVPIRYDSRRNVDDIVLNDLESLEENDLLKGGIVFHTLRESANMKTAQVKKKFLSNTFPKGKLTDDCKLLVAQILKRIKEIKREQRASKRKPTIKNNLGIQNNESAV